MEVERRPVTVLCSDLVGFTPFTERRGEEAAYVLIKTIHRLVSRAVEAHGGTIKELTGDGIIALFGVPVALEDAPLRACRAALSIQQRLADEADAFEAARGARPQLRISINAGTVIVGPAEGGAGLAVFGDTLNTAARLQALAPPGAILLGEAAHKLVQAFVDCEFIGLCPLKGKAEPQPAYRLHAIRPGVSRFQAALVRGLSRHVGRARALDRLDSILLSSKRHLRVVDIVGEPGIGKSRLLHEFRSRSVVPESPLLVSCSPDGRAVPFRPLIEIVCGCFGVTVGEAPEMVARRLSDGLIALELFSPQNLGLLLQLLGLAALPASLEGVPIELRQRDLLQELLQARCRGSRLVILLEDLQWIDSASEEVLARIIQAGDASALAILHTRRPEYLPPWLDHASTTTLRLGPLSGAGIRRIAQGRIGGGHVPDPLLRLIVERADGNPLFAEEIASSLLERGVLRRKVGILEYDASVAAGVLPTSLKSLLASRMDALEPRDRSVLRVAAVIGRRFNVEILAAVVGDEGDLGKRLAALEAQDLLRRDDAPRDFAFRHALLRDVLYDSLLGADRAALHLRIAAEIEHRNTGRPAGAVGPSRSIGERPIAPRRR
jgi:class 3 adenylate cyclase